MITRMDENPSIVKEDPIVKEEFIKEEAFSDEDDPNESEDDPNEPEDPIIIEQDDPLQNIQPTLPRAFILRRPVSKVCPICGEVKTSMIEHLKRAHKKTLLFCSICDHSTRNIPSDMKKHFAEVHPDSPFAYPCDQCSKTFEFKTRLQQHVKAYHTERLSYFCEICQKLFQSRNGLQIHWTGKECCLCRRVITKYKKEKPTTTTVASKPLPLYSCHVCLVEGHAYDAYYREFDRFEKHMRLQHIPDQLPIKCPVSGCTHDKHQRLQHTPLEVPFKCPVSECTLVCPDFEDCVSHLEDHGKDYQYKCVFCPPGNIFSSKERITAHVELHHPTQILVSASYRPPQPRGRPLSCLDKKERCPLCAVCQTKMKIYSTRLPNKKKLALLQSSSTTTTSSSPSESSYDMNGDDLSEDSCRDDPPLFDGVTMEDLMNSDEYKVTIKVEEVQN